MKFRSDACGIVETPFGRIQLEPDTEYDIEMGVPYPPFGEAIKVGEVTLYERAHNSPVWAWMPMGEQK